MYGDAAEGGAIKGGGDAAENGAGTEGGEAAEANGDVEGGGGAFEGNGAAAGGGGRRGWQLARLQAHQALLELLATALEQAGPPYAYVVCTHVTCACACGIYMYGYIAKPPHAAEFTIATVVQYCYLQWLSLILTMAVLCAAGFTSAAAGPDVSGVRRVQPT